MMNQSLSFPGRGFLAATGVAQPAHFVKEFEAVVPKDQVIGNDEGLAVGDGPCRHFGTPGGGPCMASSDVPGCFSSYYELEASEKTLQLHESLKK